MSGAEKVEVLDKVACSGLPQYKVLGGLEMRMKSLG